MDGKRQKLMSRLEELLAEYYGEDRHGRDFPDGWGAFQVLGIAYGPREGCLNEDSCFWTEDVERGIINLFHDFFSAIVEEVEETLKIDSHSGWTKITVEPSYEDTSYIVINRDSQLLLSMERKAWNFQWDTPDEMADEMLDFYNQIEAGLKPKKVNMAKKVYIHVSGGVVDEVWGPTGLDAAIIDEDNGECDGNTEALNKVLQDELDAAKAAGTVGQLDQN